VLAAPWPCVPPGLGWPSLLLPRCAGFVLLLLKFLPFVGCGLLLLKAATMSVSLSSWLSESKSGRGGRGRAARTLAFVEFLLSYRWSAYLASSWHVSSFALLWMWSRMS